MFEVGVNDHYYYVFMYVLTTRLSIGNKADTTGVPFLGKSQRTVKHVALGRIKRHVETRPL